jgi:hypothetical protein
MQPSGSPATLVLMFPGRRRPTAGHKEGYMLCNIKKISVFGDKMILSDGSQWLISEAYAWKCAKWHETQRIVVKEVDAKLSQYRLINVDAADAAEAYSVQSKMSN